jgi:ABC-type transport system involved in multi-copper enzyme maturation permease subunit
MIASIKAEIRKLYTVRSTYATLAFCLVLMVIFAFWVEGIKAGDNGKAVTDPYKLAILIREGVSFLAFFGSLVGILLITTEYRYNTITYTLTAVRRRSQTLFAKIVAVTLFSVFLTIFVAVFATALMYLGLAIKGFSLTHQIFPADLVWRVFFMSWGYGMWGLFLGTLIRQQVGAFAAFFAIPIFIEPLLTLLLKNNAIYLPYNVITQVATNGGFNNALSHGKAALTFLLYLAIGWAVAWYLFLRRDAS